MSGLVKAVGVAVAAIALLLGSLAVAQEAVPADEADIARGRDLYVRTGCYACHGYVGQGGLAGPRIAPDPLPVPAMIAYLRRPAGVMPPYHVQVLPDAQVVAIHRYLASVPPPPPVLSIPLLRD